jgi:tripartite-type tricarboxylate transporter receptor subunit TctC
MQIPRRRLLTWAGACAAGACAIVPPVVKLAQAETYPIRPIHLVVGFPEGGPNDILARLIARWLSERLAQPVIVDNRPGASGNIATEVVVRAPADGYTLLMVGPANAINASLYNKLPFNFLRDIAPVAAITREPLVMLIHPSVAATSVPEFIAYARSNPGKIKIASAGNGSSPHVSALLFMIMTGVDLSIAQYAGGGPALKALMEGQEQVMFEPISASIAAIRAGKLRPLAVTTAMRSAVLPEIPPLGEFVPGYEASAVTGIGVPANTSGEIIDRLNAEINAAFSDPTMKASLRDTGGMTLAGSPADFGRMMTEETEKWAKVILAANIKPE